MKWQVRLLDRVRMLDDAQLLQLLPLQSVVADLNSMLATVAERLELSGERAHTRVASSDCSQPPRATNSPGVRPRTFPNDSTSPVRANGSAGSGASVSCGEDVSVGMHSPPQMRRCSHFSSPHALPAKPKITSTLCFVTHGRSLEDNSDGRMATTHMLASPDRCGWEEVGCTGAVLPTSDLPTHRFSPAGHRADSKGLERHMELIVQALMVRWAFAAAPQSDASPL